MSSGEERNNRRRERLHAKQGGKCYYCPDEIGARKNDNGKPVLEHYIPRSAGGRTLVLACNSCDKMKGMIPGPEFERIIAENAIEGKAFNQYRHHIAAAAKRRNTELQIRHHARVSGMAKTQERTARIAESIGVTITDYPVPAQHAGNSGRDQFIAEWEANRPSTGDRHYQAWTGKERA